MRSRSTVSLLSCCDSQPTMITQNLYEKCNHLPIPSLSYALTSSCNDLVDTVLALHSNTVSAQEAVSIREAAERRSQFARITTRSVSAPSRKRWFRSKHYTEADGMQKSSGSHEVVCDEFTKKLVAAITTWHDIHSSLLRLSIDRSSESDDVKSISSSSSYSSLNSIDDEEHRNDPPDTNHLSASTARYSISNPDLTNCHIRQMFPEMADHWRFVQKEKKRNNVFYSGSMNF